MVFSTYQVYGAYAYLYQHWNQDVAESLTESAGLVLPRAWDPLCHLVPYDHLKDKLFKPPDCFLRCALTIGVLLGLYSVPLVRGAWHLTFQHVCLSFQARAKVIQPCIALATEQDSCARNTPVSFDTNGIPFIIDNSVTCIICNKWSLFTKPLG